MNRHKQLHELPDQPENLSDAAVDIWYKIGNTLIENGKLTPEKGEVLKNLCFWEDQKFDVMRKLQADGSAPLTQIGGENVAPTKAAILLSNIRAIQIEIDKLREVLGLEPEKPEDFSNVPSIPNEAYNHLPGPIRSCCEFVKDAHRRDTFLVLSLPVLTSQIFNVLVDHADGYISTDLFTFVVDQNNTQTKYANKALELCSVLKRQLLMESEGSHQTLQFFLKSEEKEFQENFYKQKGKGLIFENNLEDALNSKLVESGIFSKVMKNTIDRKPVAVTINQQNRLIENPSLSAGFNGSVYDVQQLREAIGGRNLAAFSFYIFDNPGAWESQRPSGREKRLNEAIENVSQKMFLLYEILGKRNQPLFIDLSDDQWEMIDSTFAEKMEIINELKLPTILQTANQYTAKVALKMAALFGVISAFSKDPDILKNEDRLTPSESDMIAALWLSDTFIKHAIRLFQYIPESGRTNVKGERFSRFYATLPATFNSAEAITIAEKLSIPERTARRYLSSFTKEKKLKRLRKGVYQKI